MFFENEKPPILKWIVSVAIIGIGLSTAQVFAEEQASDGESIEEVVVVGRFLNAAQQLLNERREDDSVIDVLDSESISRLGDSTVANAMRRMTGVSLVSDKFVYVRGLGERYSSTTLNGASIPSPDLTRNVIPLDIFPASIVSGLSVQKTFSPDIRANFAGGLIDVRTTAFPDQGTNFSIEVGSGDNSESSGNLLSYRGGSDDDYGKDDGTRAIPQQLLQAIDQYRGNLSPATILTSFREGGNADATFADAQAVNRSLAVFLNREGEVRPARNKLDQNIRTSGGTAFELGDSLEIGIQVSGGYESSWRHRERRAFNFAQPEERFSVESRTTQSINLNGLANVGLAYGSDHEVSAGYIFIRNTDNEAVIDDFFNENRIKSDGIGFRRVGTEFEQRELAVHQFRGDHELGSETLDTLPLLGFLPEGSTVEWHYTDSEATTNIPNATVINFDTTTDGNGRATAATIQRDTSAADFRFTDLDDDVLSYGYEAVLPVEFESSRIEVTFGYQYDRKARLYAQREFGLGSANTQIEGSSASVFSDSNILDPDNGFELRIQGAGSRSYIAATTTASFFVMADLRLNDAYRITAGFRREDYKQVALPWNLYGYSVQLPQVTTDPAALDRASFDDSKLFPSLTFGYTGEFWADEFQARASWSRTAIRPDLREVSDTSYVDPLTDELTFGNPDAIPSEIDNFDIRFDFIWIDGNSFTVGAFYKDIQDPIEFYETPASDTNRARGIINAESSELTGIEVEGLLRLSRLGDLGERFFVQGNATLQDTETVAGVRADAPTNEVREAAGASDYLVNLMLGFDSNDGSHTASIIYNVFGDRLYRAGRLGAPDEFEKPFHSLDVTYSWFPSENFTIKAKVQNLLDEKVIIEAAGITVFERIPGLGYLVSLKYDL